MKTNRISLTERIFLALVLLLLSGVEAHALPEASCNQTLQDFQKIKTELQQAKAKNPCSVVLNAKISKYEKSNSCAEVYLVADRTVAGYEAQRKSGCTNLQGLVTKAKSCNPNGASQATCFQAAAEAYEFASNFEKQMVGSVDQNLAKLGLVETAGQKALEKYQYDLKESKAAVLNAKNTRRDSSSDVASNAREAQIQSATTVNNHTLHSGITGDVNASDGGKKTIVEYIEALRAERGHIAAHSEALRFANDFRLEAEKLKKGMQQRISSFDQAAKDSRSRANNSGTATDDKKPPTAEASGGSGISMPSLPSSAGADSPADSGTSSSYPEQPVENSTTEAKKTTNSTFDKTSSKQTVKPKVDSKNVNRESISYQKSSTVNISGGVNGKEKKSSRFEFSSKKLGGKSSQNFESKGSALLGVLRDKAAEEKNEEKSRQQEDAHSIADAGGDLEEKKDPGTPQPDELPAADGEGDGEATADAEEAQSDEVRETASLDPSEVQEDLGFDLSTSLFDRVNRKLFHAYKTGRVIYDR